MEKDFEELIVVAEPIGSVPQPWDTTYSDRKHKGKFSKENPYLSFLQASNSRKDADALFERSVEWQADNANYLRERADKRADLLEQREYDSPAAQVAREQAAGINTDLIASGGGTSAGRGSSVAVQPTSMADQTAQTKFNNTYDNIAQLFEGFGVVSSFITAVTGGISQMGQLHQSLQLMPAQKRVADVQATIAESTQEDVIGGVNLTSIGHRVNLANQLADMFTPEQSVKDIATFLGTIGYDESQTKSLSEFVDKHRNSAPYKAYYERKQRDYLNDLAYNKVNSIDDLTTMYGNLKSIGRANEALELTRLSIDNSVANLLLKSGFAKQKADNLIEGENLTSEIQSLNADEIQFAKDKLNYDVSVFATGLIQVKDACNSVQEEIDKLTSSFKSTNGSIDRNERAILDRLQNNLISLKLLGSTKIEQVTDILNNCALQVFSSTLLENNGYVTKPRDSVGFERYSIFQELTFDKVMGSNMNSSQIAGALTNGVFSLIDDAIKLGGKSKGSTTITKRSGNTTTSTTSLF